MAIAKRVLIAGGGVAGVEALLALSDLAGERVELTMLSPTGEFAFRAMAVAEPFGHGPAAHHSLAEIADAVGARVVSGALAAVDSCWRVAVTADGTPLAYDMLLAAVGTRPEPVLHGALTWTPESDPELLGGLLRDVEQGYSKRVAFVAPPGVAWTLPLYELALMTARQAWSMGQDDVRLTIYTPEPAPVAVLGSRVSDEVRRELELAGVDIRTGVCVFDDALAPGRLVLHDRWARTRTQEPLDAARVVALPRAVAPRISGLPSDPEGFVPVDEHSRVRGLDCVWAAGDATDNVIKQGGLAAQQADAAAESIAAAAGAEIEPEPFCPVLRGVMLTGRGGQWLGKRLEADADPASAAQAALWQPPAKVAGRHLTAFLTGTEKRLGVPRPVGLPYNVDLGSALSGTAAPVRRRQNVESLA